jgi:energy-coupling factor transporter ATP-binding protein EcfA2
VQVAAPPAVSEHRNPTIVGGHAQAYERERPPAYLLTSDGRSFDRIGVPSTWIKLDEVSPVGLREAFVDADSRVSYDDPARLRRGPRLVGIGWHGGMLGGVRIGLSEQLTCLIGRNGSGKSAVLESIRYALGLGHATPRGERAAEALLAGVLDDGRGVTLAVETDGHDERERRRYLVLRPAGGGDPLVCDADGTPQPDIDPADLIEPRLIGQGELAAIGTSAQAQLELLDALARDSGHGDGRGGRRGIVSRLNEALTGRLRIELGAQPAGVTIEASVGRPREAYEFRPLDDLPPGQQRAALLMLVLEAHSRAPGPLVLDQPEEGLDGSTVDELLTRRLRELKRSGQVVLATHDHSLPLLCDAEQIVALESVRPRKKHPRFIQVRAHGAIDRADVRAAAEEILEGGGASYSLRSAKYGR